MSASSDSVPEVAFRDALAVWLRIGLLSFGGPAGQIALMHRMLVEERRWISEARFLHALNYCMLLPGPEAQQLATYVGWLLHGVRGGLVAGLLFILPGATAILLLSWLYVLLGDLSLVAGLFFGLKAAVLAIVLQALIRVARRTLGSTARLLLAAAAFLALFAFGVPFPFVVLGAGLLGLVATRWFQESGAAAMGKVEDSPVVRPGTGRAALACLLLWIGTLLLLAVLLGTGNVFTRIAVFFSTMAVVTFGGAYAVLAWVAQQAVEHYQWLLPGEMVDGLGLAETTPGPLILVTQFVGFLAAWRGADPGMALAAGTLGALLTTWVTFLPCFVWIFAGAPHVERLRGQRRLAAALAAITAAVVGVIANLALWFATRVLFGEQRQLAGIELPVLASIELPMLGLAVLACLLLFRYRLDVLRVLGACALAGMLWFVVSGG